MRLCDYGNCSTRWNGPGLTRKGNDLDNKATRNSSDVFARCPKPAQPPDDGRPHPAWGKAQLVAPGEAESGGPALHQCSRKLMAGIGACQMSPNIDTANSVLMRSAALVYLGSLYQQFSFSAVF